MCPTPTVGDPAHTGDVVRHGVEAQPASSSAKTHQESLSKRMDFFMAEV
jgi:hypothetical protein